MIGHNSLDNFSYPKLVKVNCKMNVNSFYNLLLLELKLILQATFTNSYLNIQSVKLTVKFTLGRQDLASMLEGEKRKWNPQGSRKVC